jgi:hypothetical protein
MEKAFSFHPYKARNVRPIQDASTTETLGALGHVQTSYFCTCNALGKLENEKVAKTMRDTGKD